MELLFLFLFANGIDLALTWFFDPHRIRTFFCVKIEENSVLFRDDYAADLVENGGWKIDTGDPGEFFLFVSTVRANDFLMKKLRDDGDDLLCNQIIKAGKGVHLSKKPVQVQEPWMAS